MQGAWEKEMSKPQSLFLDPLIMDAVVLLGGFGFVLYFGKIQSLSQKVAI